MAADTKRRAVWVTVNAKHNGVMVTLDSLREQLAAQDLYVVTAADLAVLDACAEEYIVPGVHPRFAYSAEAVVRAELARREAAK